LLSGMTLGLALFTSARAALFVPGLLGYLASERSRRAWLRRPEPWIALGMASVFLLPAWYWSYEHAGGSLADASERGTTGATRLLIDLASPILALNPYVLGCGVLGSIALARARMPRSPGLTLCAWIAWPALALAIAAPGSALHPALAWDLAALALLPIAGAWIARRPSAPLIPAGAWISAAAIALVLIVGLGQLDLGLIRPEVEVRDEIRPGRGPASDPTITMRGWRQLARDLPALIAADRALGKAAPRMLLAAHRATSARLDFYVGSKMGLETLCLADLEASRSATLAGESLPGKGASGYLVVASDGCAEPALTLAGRFASIEEPRFVDLARGGRLLRRFAISRCDGWRPPAPTPPRDAMERFEFRAFFAVNNGLHSELGDWLLGYPNLLGVGYISGPIVFVALAWSWRRRRRDVWRRDLAAITVSSLLCAALVTTVKQVCSRDRPLRMFRAALDRGAAEVHVLLSEKYQHGFPSGHTATAFLIATLLVSIWPRPLVGVIGYALALLVGVSTMYVGVHLPFDVLAGMLVGTIVALWGYRLTSLLADHSRARKLSP
jgi:undecaprenyl-diphosphatase